MLTFTYFSGDFVDGVSKIVRLFDIDRNVVTKHLKNVFAIFELFCHGIFA